MAATLAASIAFVFLPDAVYSWLNHGIELIVVAGCLFIPTVSPTQGESIGTVIWWRDAHSRVGG